MSTAFEVRSPGKLVLVGEYAVVDGGPAVVLAIDRGVRCTVTPGGTGVDIQTPGGDTRFVAPALADASPGSYRFADWNPVDLPGKPGFGGSAAACVAACIAAGRPAEEALAIHARVQGGGSGVDVRASIHGGMVRVEGGRVQALEPVLPVVIYSGQSARTGPRVARYLAWRDREAFLARSAEAVARFTTEPLAALEDDLQALLAMSRAAGLDYLSPGLARIVALARAHGGTAKPSGAGGGDCAVALFSDSGQSGAFAAACEAEGFPPIPVQVAPAARRVPLGKVQ